MRAIVFRDYGDPQEVMELVDDSKIPKPNKNEVLVKIECASLMLLIGILCELITLLFGWFLDCSDLLRKRGS